MLSANMMSLNVSWEDICSMNLKLSKASIKDSVFRKKR